MNRREGERKEKKIRFFLRSTKIGLYVFIIIKGKVGPRIESYAWIPKSLSFIKLHEVGNFLTFVIFIIKVILWLEIFLRGRKFQSQIF